MTFYATREEMATRSINDRGYGLALEVGVREGYFATHILNTTSACLTGIDVHVLASARRLEEGSNGNFLIAEKRSPGCASDFGDGVFDFIHIDADHSREAVAADLEAWWPKVKPGGMLTGDDYADVDNPSEGRYGVVEAVNAFADRHGLKVYVTGVSSTDRAAQLAHAASQGREINREMRRQPYEPFVNPAWYVYKEA